MTEYEARGYSTWGSWNGFLAQVVHEYDKFDPREFKRIFHVRFAVDGGSRVPVKPIDIGMPIIVSNQMTSYDKVTFKLGRLGSSTYIPEGRFSPLEKMEVPVSLREMTEHEHMLLRTRFYEEKRVHVDSTLKKKSWEALMKLSYLECQELDSERANAVDRLVSRTANCRSDDDSTRVWEEIKSRGLYSESRDGRVKWFLEAKT